MIKELKKCNLDDLVVIGGLISIAAIFIYQYFVIAFTLV